MTENQKYAYEYETLLVEFDKGVCILTLNRPEKRNAMNPTLGEEITDAATGTGPVDAVYMAINRVIGVENRLTEFRVDSVTEGIDAIGDVTIRIELQGDTFVGRGSDTDIIVASAKAYMNALNRALSANPSEFTIDRINRSGDITISPAAGKK